MACRWPRWREGAVGSNPQYTEQSEGGGAADTLLKKCSHKGHLWYHILNHIIPYKIPVDVDISS